MTREEYISSLTQALSFLNEETRAAALAFYTEMLDDRIEDGLDEYSAVAAMAKPEAIAARLRAENSAGDSAFRREGKNFEGLSAMEEAMRTAESAIKSVVENAKEMAAQAGQAAEAAQKRMEEMTAQASQKAEAAQERMENAWDSTQAPDKVEDYERRTLSMPASEIHAIRLRGTDMPMKITPSSNDEITLTYYTCAADEYRAYAQDGVLILEPVSSQPGLAGFRMSFLGREVFKVLWSHSVPTIELTLPADALVDLWAETSNGSVQMRDLNALCETILRTSNSRISLENISCKSLSAQTSNGRLVLKNISSKRGLLGKTSNGRIEGQWLSSGEDMELKSSNGSMMVTEAKAKGTMTLKSSNSGLNVKQAASEGLMTLTTSNGSIIVSEIAAPALTIRTSNSSIRGTLPGPQSAWNIDSGTSNGHNSLPKQQPGEKPLSVHTSNGSIHLTFSE